MTNTPHHSHHPHTIPAPLVAIDALNLKSRLYAHTLSHSHVYTHAYTHHNTHAPTPFFSSLLTHVADQIHLRSSYSPIRFTVSVPPSSYFGPTKFYSCLHVVYMCVNEDSTKTKSKQERYREWKRKCRSGHTSGDIDSPSDRFHFVLIWQVYLIITFSLIQQKKWRSLFTLSSPTVFDAGWGSNQKLNWMLIKVRTLYLFVCASQKL